MSGLPASRGCVECGGQGWVTEPGPEYNLPNQIVCDHCGGRGEEPLADSNPSKRQYCYPQCRDPWFNECADCWQSGGNPAIGVKADEPKPPTDSNPDKRQCECDAPRCEREGCQDRPTPRFDAVYEEAMAVEREMDDSLPDSNPSYRRMA